MANWGFKPMDEDDPMLALGLSQEELKAYELLLSRPGSTVSDMVAVTPWSSRRTKHLLESLEIKGMTTCLPERPPRYLPTPPDVALEALMARKQNELQRARLSAQRWHAKMQEAKHPRIQEPLIEIIAGRDAIAHIFDQIQRAAQRELLGLERPPYVTGSPHQHFEVQKQAIARGVVYRNIVDATVLEIPGKADAVRKDVEGGEKTRVLSGLPLKLVIADRRIALIPLNLAQASDTALLVRPSSLLDALCELFEILWQRATPFGIASLSASPSASARLPVDSDKLVSLLAAGMNDKAIAYELGLSARTMERRIVELMQNLDARTRFQAGWQAALRTISSTP
jgi:sugar-specific transcriptional regulator TrmB